MFSLGVVLIALLGVMQTSLKVSGTEVDLTVKPGNNVTLYGDCSWTYGSTIYWYKNCLHCRKPSFALSTQYISIKDDSSFPHYQSKLNSTSQSHDLLIKNITESELGVYYCCMVESEVMNDDVITQYQLYRFGNITYKLSFNDVTPTLPPSSSLPDCHQCWSQLAIWCPVCALLSALISSTCVYCLCRSKTATVDPVEHSKRGENPRGIQGEDRDLCYASLEVPTRAHTAKPKKKRTPTQNSDFSTYSEVRRN